MLGGQESSGRRKTSKYFATDKQKPKDEKETKEIPAKRKTKIDVDSSTKSPPSKKIHKVDDKDDDFVLPIENKTSVGATPSKKLKSGSGRGVAQKSIGTDEVDEDDVKNTESPLKSSGRGHGGRGASGAPAGGRGRGGGRGGFMNFGDRKDPPHKGEKVEGWFEYFSLLSRIILLLLMLTWFFVCQEVPEGAPDCLAGLTFVISGTLDR